MARRRAVRNNPLVVMALVALAAVLGLRLADRSDGTTPAPTGEATVVEVTDGDTIVVRFEGAEERVRLIGIDTPESVAPDQPVECFGPEASNHLKELLPPGTRVRLERDVEPRDRYGRLLAYVYRADDNLLVNRDQVANGFAEAKEYPPNTALAADLEAAESTARSTNIGMWAAC